MTAVGRWKCFSPTGGLVKCTCSLASWCCTKERGLGTSGQCASRFQKTPQETPHPSAHSLFASQGDEFANIFSHFAPLDWRGPNDSDSPTYHGFVKGRCDTVADEGGVSQCRELNSGKFKDNEVELDLSGVVLPPLGDKDRTSDEL